MGGAFAQVADWLFGVGIMHKVVHYASSLVFLIAVCFVYHVVSKQWLTRPKITQVRVDSKKSGANKESISDIFPAGSWQLGECKQLQTDGGILLFQNWDQISDDEWKLWPVTLVIGRGMSGELDPEPVIMEAAMGAELKFTESLEIFSGDAPPIERGRLIDKVHIRRQGVDKNESFSLHTSNVGINNKKIWTTETIEMNVGRAKMVGRDLTLFLAAAASPENASSDINSVLDRMELIYLDEFTLPLENGPLWEPSKSARNQPTRLPATHGASPMPAMIHIKCAGRVDYDFQIDQLSMRDSISLIHYVPGGLQDRFNCQTLDLMLRDPYDDSFKRETPLDWIDRITAQGTPASADLPSFDINMKAERIEFDTTRGIVTAGGRGGVEVGSENLTARLSQFIYQYDPKQPKSIGAIDASGAGIVTITDPELSLREVRWRDGFKLRPSNIAVIDPLNVPLEFWVDGGIEASFKDGGKFSAGAIEGVLKPDPRDVASVTNGPNKKRGLKIPKMMPERIQASRNVRVAVTSLAAETELLRLFFVQPADPASISIGNAASGGSSLGLQQIVSQPKHQDGLVNPVAKQRPVIRGDMVSAQLVLHPDGPVANDLSVTGNVRVEHVVNVGNNALPAKLTGEQLKLSNQAGKELVQLGSGPSAPARLDIGDGFFVGPMILIWPSENFVQIRGAGEFQMPREIMPSAMMSDDRIVWSKPPHCQWNGEMRFDGREAHLTDGVQIDAEFVENAEPWRVRMSGAQLQFVLTEPVKVGEMQTIKRAGIRQITMHQSAKHPVLLTAERAATDGVMEARHMMHAPQLTLLPTEGKLMGLGPGWYRSWFLAPKEGPLAAANKNQTANDRKLTGVHLSYHEALDGDFQNKTLSFIRGVRVGVKALDDWQAAFDAAELQDLAVGESTIDCDRLSIGIAPGFDPKLKVPGLKTPWEVTAEDSIMFRTRTEKNGLMEVSGARAAYSSGKDLFTMQGTPNHGGEIRQTHPNGQPGSKAVFKEITMNLMTFDVKNMVVHSFNIGNPNPN